MADAAREIAKACPHIYAVTAGSCRVDDVACFICIAAALDRARAERDMEWWEACAAVDTVAPTPEAVRAWHIALTDLAFKEGREEAHRACPCLHTTPCDLRCTCINSFSSFGCQRCCSYGNPEQQRSAAERLVNARAEALEEAAKVADGWAHSWVIAARIRALRSAPEESTD